MYSVISRMYYLDVRDITINCYDDRDYGHIKVTIESVLLLWRKAESSPDRAEGTHASFLYMYHF